MNREDWQRAKEIFHRALDEPPENRAAFLDEACAAGNAPLRELVEILLESYETDFLEEPLLNEKSGLFRDVIDKSDAVENDSQAASDADSIKSLTRNETKVGIDENDLRPSRIRFVLVCLFFAFVTVWLLISYRQLFTEQNRGIDFNVSMQNQALVVGDVQANSMYHEKLQTGDEIVSLNNVPVKMEAEFIKALTRLEPNKGYTLQIKRGDELLSVELIPKDYNSNEWLRKYFWAPILPPMYLILGFALFLLKPNHKAAFLTLILFACLACAVFPFYLYHKIAIEPASFAVWTAVGEVIGTLYPSLMLHLFLIFPNRLRVLHRFPQIEWLIYIPYAIYALYLIGDELSRAELINFNTDASAHFLFGMTYWLGHATATIIAMTFNYRQSDEIGKRRVRIIIFAYCLILGVQVLVKIPLSILSVTFKYEIPATVWNVLHIYNFFEVLSFALIFTYAVMWHKVIPVSFVIRRGLQYLLAKNAFRLLLVLPVFGIVWNIAANPSRPLDEILLRNSTEFYVFVFLAVTLLLLNRFSLREWIDKRFFREQYDQEKILRESVEAVKKSDSLPTLSRLVSSKIEAALHPENVFLFFRDDANHSDFSLGYMSNGASGEKSAELKLAADSPLLQFMQTERCPLDFPSRQTDVLHRREKRWLQEIGAHLLVPMHGTDGKLAGFFSLGEKKSEIPYTRRDKELLETLANQIALVHENLNLRERMHREQRIKAEVLARFDEGNINLLKECPICGRCYNRTDENCERDGKELTFTLPVERTIENRYRLEKLIGKGGMGAVYEATDTRINRAVALKILSGAMFGNRDALRRFEREAQTAGRLQHPNIVTIHDYGVLSSEGAFLVMELVKGESLRNILESEGTLDSETVKEWFSQILDGLEAAHSAGIVHRDLKPDNIILESRNSGAGTAERLCILDFGLARLKEREIEMTQSVTIPGTIMGTFGYMSPEQLRGDKTDERSDLFSVGVMIHEALEGEKPFRGKTYHQLIRAMSEEIVFDFPEPIRKFFEKALAKSRKQRFSSADQMKQALLALE